MRPRPFSTKAYLRDVSAALRKRRVTGTGNSPVIGIMIATSAWLAFFWLIFWLVSALPKPDLHDRALIDPANPRLGDVKYYQNHFWYWAVVDGKGQWVDP